MRIQLFTRVAVVALLCAAGASIAHAATTDAAEAVDGVVVNGRSLEDSLPQDLARYGSAIEMVTGQEVRDGGFVDVASALDLVPGLYIKPGSGPFSYVDVSLQGSRTQDVLWTVDGIRINNRLYGGTSPNDTLPASMIERVEVLKGGESLFYGTQAAAGVINVVTRGFTDDFNGQANAAIDDRAGYSFDGYVRGSLGEHRFVAYASRNESEGYRPYSVMQPSATDRKRGYDLWSVGGKYQYDFSDDLRLNLQYQHTNAKLDNLSATRVRQSRNDRKEDIASVRLDYTGNEAVQFFLKGYYHNWKTAYVQILNDVNTGAPITVYPAGTYWGYQDYGGSALVKLHPHKGLEYLVGYDFQNFSGRDDVLLIGKTREQVHAGIFQVRTTDEISTRARAAIGLRYNKTGGAEKTVWNVTGRFDITDQLYVEGIGGTSFVLPDASSLYGIDPCCEVGNPNLRPEESRNLNLSVGGKQAFGDTALTWRATYFARRIDDLIDADYDNPAFPNGIYVNVDKQVEVQGLEGQVNAAIGEAWRLSASYTWTEAHNKGSDLQRDRTPEQFAKGSVAYAPAGRPFGANLSVSWVGDVYSTPFGFGRRNYGDYAVIDMGAYLYLDGEARRSRLGLNVENAFNEDYATRGLGSAPRDDGAGRFLYFNRGLPRTVRISYGLSF